MVFGDQIPSLLQYNYDLLSVELRPMGEQGRKEDVLGR